ncbi:hypothetical protein [Winogradskyella maritima]|uniref:Uncharacterized protein n=1 Tax=Winogradskyella maritima TaxID=1517766 RepID=A0ABV8AJ30_9FLAO
MYNDLFQYSYYMLFIGGALSYQSCQLAKQKPLKHSYQFHVKELDSCIVKTLEVIDEQFNYNSSDLRPTKPTSKNSKYRLKFRILHQTSIVNKKTKDDYQIINETEQHKFIKQGFLVAHFLES